MDLYTTTQPQKWTQKILTLWTQWQRNSNLDAVHYWLINWRILETLVIKVASWMMRYPLNWPEFCVVVMLFPIVSNSKEKLWRTSGMYSAIQLLELLDRLFWKISTKSSFAVFARGDYNSLKLFFFLKPLYFILIHKNLFLCYCLWRKVHKRCSSQNKLFVFVTLSYLKYVI